MARGEEGLQVLRDHVVEHRAAGIPRYVGGHCWRHTSPHGQQGEQGSTRSCHPIYCSNVQYASKIFPEDTEETRGTHHRATVPSLGVVHTVVAKVRCRVGREVAHPGPSPDPDKEISTIRLFRRCDSWLPTPDPDRDPWVGKRSLSEELRKPLPRE